MREIVAPSSMQLCKKHLGSISEYVSLLLMVLPCSNRKQRLPRHHFFAGKEYGSFYAFVLIHYRSSSIFFVILWYTTIFQNNMGHSYYSDFKIFLFGLLFSKSRIKVHFPQRKKKYTAPRWLVILRNAKPKKCSLFQNSKFEWLLSDGFLGLQFRSVRL